MASNDYLLDRCCVVTLPKRLFSSSMSAAKYAAPFTPFGVSKTIASEPNIQPYNLNRYLPT